MVPYHEVKSLQLIWRLGTCRFHLQVPDIQVFCSNLTHWGRVTHICVRNLTVIGSDNGSSPGLHQGIIWTNAGILLIGPLGTNLSGILIEIHTFSFNKMHLKMSSGKWRPFCLGLSVLTAIRRYQDSRCPQHVHQTKCSTTWYYIWHIVMTKS